MHLVSSKIALSEPTCCGYLFNEELNLKKKKKKQRIRMPPAERKNAVGINQRSVAKLRLSGGDGSSWRK